MKQRQTHRPRPIDESKIAEIGARLFGHLLPTATPHPTDTSRGKPVDESKIDDIARRLGVA